MDDFNFELKGFVQSVNGEKPDESGNVDVGVETNAVKTVNNKAPDSKGNVDIDAADLGAATIADLTAETTRATAAEQENAAAIKELKQQAYTVTGETLVILKPNIATVTGETLVIQTA